MTGYAVKADGSFRAVDDASWCVDGEIYQEDQPEMIEDSQAQINAHSRAYLQETDWYVIRMTETGEPIPKDVLVKRKEARGSVK
jgi:hypothetical protein